MKKNIIFLAAATALLALSCTNLDVDIKSLYTEYPTTDVALEAKMADVYYCFRGALGRRYGESSSLSSDEQTAISFDGDYYDGGTYAHSALHNYSPDDASVGWYGDLAAGITKANQAILDLGGYDSPASAYARAMRAFYLFLLMDNYGDVPIIDGPVTDAVERQPRAKVAEYLESELLEVIPLLTEEVSVATYGKPTKWMAEALLAKIYLNWAVYTASDVTAYEASGATNSKLNDLVALCDEIITSGKFSLAGGEQSGNGGTPLNPYRAKFYPNNGPQIKDFIYAMPYDAVTQQGFQYARPRIWRQGRNDGAGGAGYFGTDIGASCGGNFSLTPEAAARFDAAKAEGDLRAGQVIGGTIYMYDPTTWEVTDTPYKYKDEEVVLTASITLVEGGEEALNTGKNVTGWSQGYKSVKYFVIQDDYKNGRNQSNDLPIFRYADILLMKAEAIVRGATATNGDTAASLVNQVRSYAKAPAKSAVDLAVIENERALEFFDENWRRNDMIRFGHFENEYCFHRKDFPTANFDKTRRILPIPTGVLNENTNWKQNPGY